MKLRTNLLSFLPIFNQPRRLGREPQLALDLGMVKEVVSPLPAGKTSENFGPVPLDTDGKTGFPLLPEGKATFFKAKSRSYVEVEPPQGSPKTEKRYFEVLPLSCDLAYRVHSGLPFRNEPKLSAEDQAVLERCADRKLTRYNPDEVAQFRLEIRRRAAKAAG